MAFSAGMVCMVDVWHMPLLYSTQPIILDILSSRFHFHTKYIKLYYVWKENCVLDFINARYSQSSRPTDDLSEPEYNIREKINLELLLLDVI